MTDTSDTCARCRHALIFHVSISAKPVPCTARGGKCGCEKYDDGEDWPVHQPEAPEAPIPGRHWYAACDPDLPRVDPETGRCTSCGEPACRVCGRENCPDHEEESDDA